MTGITAFMSIKEARKTMSILLKQLAGIRRRVTTAACTNPAITTQVEASTNDTFSIVGTVP